MKIDSYLVHEEKFEQTTKPHNLPILATSSFNFQNIDQGIDIFTGKEKGHVYSRYGNPTIETVAKKIAHMESYDLDGNAFGIMVSSGMSAISTLVFAELEPGDKLLTQSNLYGGTTELFKKFLKKLNVEIIFTDLSSNEEIENEIARNPTIKMIYCESPANPSLACVDLNFVGSISKSNGIISVIDNTFCTPYLQKPLNYGFDYVIHSTTKYLNGHGNSIAGIIVGRNLEDYNKMWDAMKLIGTNCNPFDAWLVNSGMKTLALRMEKHSSNALFIANQMEQNSKIAKVNYPFLDSHPQIEIVKSQMKMGGGMLSFELTGGIKQGIEFMNKIKFCSLAPTLGDVDTLILHPASMSHRNVPAEIRVQNGITDGLIRMSVGIEHPDDIYNDILQAMN